MSAFLAVESLVKEFGGIRAVDSLSLALDRGGLLCIVGPNGCGKTTLFNLITGEFPPTAGSIRFDGADITGLRPFEIGRMGVGRKFQVPGIYPHLTVRENLAVPLFAAAGRRGLLGLLARDQSAIRADGVLEQIRLGSQADRPAGALSHGGKQWLEIGMLLAGAPRLMLLDEPTAGMTAAETEATADLILRIHREAGIAVIAIEHDMGFVERLDSEVAVMMKGALLRRGSFAEVRADPVVREIYLGRRA